jgi:ribbon-helix-helix CopG family protein
MEPLINKGGRPRQYPPCNRYGAHRFSPKTNRCPCGFQRTGTEPPAKRETVVMSGIRLDMEVYRALQAISERTGKSMAELVRLAVSRLIAEDPTQGF